MIFLKQTKVMVLTCNTMELSPKLVPIIKDYSVLKDRGSGSQHIPYILPMVPVIKRTISY